MKQSDTTKTVDEYLDDLQNAVMNISDEELKAFLNKATLSNIEQYAYLEKLILEHQKSFGEYKFTVDDRKLLKKYSKV